MEVAAVEAGNLPEGKQTVPDAELTAMRRAIDMAIEPIVILYTDCKMISDGWDNHAHKTNQGLWQQIDQARKRAEQRGCKLSCRKVKSHNTEAMLAGHMNEMEWSGNMMAGAFAAEYADRIKLDVGPRADIAIADSTTRLVLARLVAIELH